MFRKLCVLFWFGLPAASGAALLYDGASGKTPREPPFEWVLLAEPLLGTSFAQYPTNGVTVLDTTASTRDKAGYFGVELVSLDRHKGYAVNVTLRLDAESHISAHRAGFSVIVLSEDGWGIELGFWTNSVWAQNVGFTRGEAASYDTGSRLVQYDLAVGGTNYSVSLAGTNLLSGPLRDYSSFGTPYTLTNFLFLGDNTSSAAGRVELAKVEVAFPPAPDLPVLSIRPPEPGSNKIILSWPEGYLLQRASELVEPRWEAVATNSPAQIPARDTSEYFRLVRGG